MEEEREEGERGGEERGEVAPGAVESGRMALDLRTTPCLEKGV